MATKEIELKVIITVNDSTRPEDVPPTVWMALDDYFAWGVKSVVLAEESA